MHKYFHNNFDWRLEFLMNFPELPSLRMQRILFLPLVATNIYVLYIVSTDHPFAVIGFYWLIFAHFGLLLAAFMGTYPFEGRFRFKYIGAHYALYVPLMAICVFVAQTKPPDFVPDWLSIWHLMPTLIYGIILHIPSGYRYAAQLKAF